MERSIRLIASMATRSLLVDVAAAWRGDHADTPVSIEAAGGVDVARRVAAGEPFDIVVLAAEAIDRLIAGGHLPGGDRTAFAVSPLTVAVAAGAPHPAIDTEEALRDAVLRAKRIAISTGPSGTAVRHLLKRWGITRSVEERLVQAPPGVPVGTLLARGDADLGFQQRSEFIGLAGIDILGGMPDGLAVETTFTACATSSADPSIVLPFLRFLNAPCLDAAKRRHGLSGAASSMDAVASDAAIVNTFQPFTRVGLVGYGEVGRILAEDLRSRGIVVRACDLRFDSVHEAHAMRQHAEAHGVEIVDTHADLARASQVVICAVTASQTLAAASATASGCAGGVWFLDLNSASPATKVLAGGIIDAVGGRYVEGAVMTSVPPYRVAVPLLLGGTKAAAFVESLNALGFAARVASPELGIASATKMCRSVVIKGMEAMIVESLTTARRYGVEDAVLRSLEETFPQIDWERQATYFFQRVIAHGRRRSEEVREVARTVAEAGLVPWSADGTAARQAWVADLADRGVFGSRSDEHYARSADWRVEADRVLAWIGRERPDALSSSAASSDNGFTSPDAMRSDG